MKMSPKGLQEQHPDINSAATLSDDAQDCPVAPGKVANTWGMPTAATAKTAALAVMAFFALASESLAADAGTTANQPLGETSTRRRPPLPILTLPKHYRDGSEGGAGFVLKPANDGSKDLITETPTFTARVSPDGSVRFQDQPAKLSLKPPWLPAPPRPGTQTLEGLLRRKLKVLPKAEPGTRQPEYSQPEAVIPSPSPFHADIKSSECRHPSPCHLALKPLILNVTGKFDITDTLLRLRGQDPYRQEKARFLEQTRVLRIRLAVQTHAENLRTQMMKLPDLLRAVACDEGREIAERRAIIEALKSEMDTTLDVGRFAVEQVRAFVARWQRDGDAVCR
jgi:hypothetical protein